MWINSEIPFSCSCGYCGHLLQSKSVFRLNWETNLNLAPDTGIEYICGPANAEDLYIGDTGMSIASGMNGTLDGSANNGISTLIPMMRSCQLQVAQAILKTLLAILTWNAPDHLIQKISQLMVLP